jgi:heme/copper-type cytochrome/quinol oxidase subunit 1
LYVLLALLGVLALIVWGWQIQVLRGKAMKNADGTADDWHEQKMFYGIAVADIFLACPVTIIGIMLVFVSPRLGSSRLGFYLLAWVSFWFVWANTMTTATSLRFEKPKITLNWLIVFPFGALVGLAYFVWTLVHFEAIYLP